MANFQDSWRSGGTGIGPYVLKPRTTSEIPLSVDGLAASGSSDILLRVRNSAGIVLFSVDNTGNLSFSGSGTITINQTVTGNLTVNGNTTLGNSTSQDTLTVTAAATFAGSATLSAGLTSNNLITLGGSTALTAGSHQIGRNVNNHNQYNVPLTQQHIFTIEDTAKLSISSTTVSINDNVVIGGTTTVNGALTVSGSISTFSSVRFADGSVSAPSISFTADTDTGFYRVSSGLIGFAINGYQGMTLGLDATFGTLLALKDNTGTPLEFQIGNFGAGAAFPRTYMVGGQDATDTNWAVRFAHKDSSSSTEIPVVFQISTNKDTSYTNADTLNIAAFTTYGLIATSAGSASAGVQLAIGTNGGTAAVGDQAILISTAATGQSVSFVPSAVAGGASSIIVTPAAHTAVIAEVIDNSFAAHTMTTTGSITTQRHTVFGVPTITSASALTTTTAATVAISATPNPTGAGPQTITNAFGLMLGTALATVPAYSASIGTTITNAAMLYIAGAPVTGGNVTVTNGYALWVDGGMSRFDAATANYRNLGTSILQKGDSTSIAAGMMIEDIQGASPGAMSITSVSGDFRVYTISGTGNFAAGDLALTISNTGASTFTPDVTTSGALAVFTITDASHTGITATTEKIAVDFDLDSTKTWAAGLVATQREFLVRAPTYATATFTTAATFAVSGAPIGTITNAYSIWAQAGVSAFVGGIVGGTQTALSAGYLLDLKTQAPAMSLWLPQTPILVGLPKWRYSIVGGIMPCLIFLGALIPLQPFNVGRLSLVLLIHGYFQTEQQLQVEQALSSSFWVVRITLPHHNLLLLVQVGLRHLQHWQQQEVLILSLSLQGRIRLLLEPQAPQLLPSQELQVLSAVMSLRGRI